jgi:hypothetical protein
LEDGLQAWKAELPHWLSFESPDTTFDSVYPNNTLQRCFLHVHYLASIVLFRRTRLFTQFKPAPKPVKSSCVEEVAIKAMELLRRLQEYRSMLVMKPRRQVCFTSTFFIFEVAVTLLIAHKLEPHHSLAAEWMKKVEDATTMLEERRHEDNGDIVQQSIRALQTLRLVTSVSSDSSSRGSESGEVVTPDFPQDANLGDVNQVFAGQMVDGTAGLSNEFLHWIQAPFAANGWSSEEMNGTVGSYDLLQYLQQG